MELYQDTPEPRNLHIPRHLYRINDTYLESMYKTYDGTPHYKKFEIEWSVIPDTDEPVFELTLLEESKRNGAPQEVEVLGDPYNDRGRLRYKKIE